MLNEASGLAAGAALSDRARLRRPFGAALAASRLAIRAATSSRRTFWQGMQSQPAGWAPWSALRLSSEW